MMFNPNYPLDVYYKAIKMVKCSEEYLKILSSSRKESNNIKFYVVMFAFLSATSIRRGVNFLETKDIASIDDIVNLDLDVMKEEFMISTIEKVRKSYYAMGGDDKIAKSRSFVVEIRKLISNGDIAKF